ncbi:WXG100 family type VII secretion target [Nocardia sp. NRRL S-836]|uniref:WXG100 family type VII secretion target n=1 Tax=Nocardia sp. NRRL S-836 TaxID=1519492 RepID=UPI0006AE4C4E|nr:PPE domain-containing protein [Nocardia sp. NRRL S-836]KOV79634.1 hypothetical protein ADL03_36385 [Nocardia sp. NRRL S-836]
MPPETVPTENEPVLTGPQNWASRSHQELYTAVHHDNDPGQAGQIGSEWGRYGSELTEAARAITRVITNSETGWTGDAAEGARAAMKKLSDWVDETARTAVQVGDKVTEQGRVMENARAQMPAPVQFDWDGAAAALSQPGTAAFALATADIAVANAQARAAHDQAVTVMTTMENSSRQIDTSTPAFTPPFNPNTGEVEEPVLAARLAAGAPTFGSADALTATHAQSAATVATAPTPTGASGAAPQGGSGYQPAAASYAPQTGAGGGVTMPTPQSYPSYSSGSTTTSGAAYTPQPPPTYTPQLPQGGNTYTGGTDHRSPFPTGTPYLGTGPGPTPRTPVPNSLTSPGNQLPKDTTLPRGTTPPIGTGPGGPGGPGGGSSAFKGGAVPNLGGGGAGAGAFGGGLGGAGGAGAVQAGGAAGVQNQPGGRPGVPMAAPGGATAAGAGTGGAPMGGPQGGKGEDDKEHRSAGYIMGGDLFDMPGADLPPSVIGAAKTKKKGLEPS